jgi:serine/threonine protein kinase/DNA-binding CsgD family transcriptional regulator
MIGTRLNNRYEVRSHLGDGSTATVYKTFDTMLGRDVALKVLLPHVRDTTAQRFFQEAKAAAHLNHPNIMSIFDIGEDNGRHFLVVEFVEGDSLSHYIPSSPEVVIELGTQIALALEYAHNNDIIHRDIKPANIKVTPEGQVKIMDLGLARPRAGKRVTAPGMVIGTPAYISPEQAQGHNLDSRTDIYSLGIVLYEMLTGELPFNADDITTLLLQHVQQAPEPPSKIVVDLPLALETVVLKVLEKNPNRRFQSMEALARALRASLPTTAELRSVGNEGDSDSPKPEWTKTIQTDNLRDPSNRSRGNVVRVLLADDHTILRKTLASFIETRDEYIIIAEASDGNEALDKVLENHPDLLILDLNMPKKSGLEVLPLVKIQAPHVKVLVLTGRDDDAYIVRALRAGANGYILKTADEEELFDSMSKVMRGELVLGRGVAEKVVTGLLDNNDDKHRLDDTERQILLYVAGGYDNATIAQQLAMSMTDIIESLATIMNKLHAKDRNSAALKALRNGEIRLENLHNLIADTTSGTGEV